MDLIPLHPKLVHLPIALAILMPLVATGLLAAWLRGALPRRTWLIVVALQGILVGSGVMASRSGERDESRVERIVPDAAIEAHEAAAEVFVGASAAVLAIALIALAIPRERVARLAAGVATIGTAAVLVLGYRTGQAGGRLVYEHGAAAAFAAPAASASAPTCAEDDHDDDD
jgi:uncharacterized membrane protein